ncbi:hypothetical protein JKA74_02970 [Marivirga sp. S37H4]|uniref:Disease resistance R13L4/SHOC-2-like LRR domain-containing protein n=1 Tax=Marivirga aurantiaca TaxID=2802615 RepID=A0A934WW41_9BACT|nr:hypothetical protein [Marivirga aurantiaca]MBK6263986.1 hypothetical protein [Marivirga aurantiaca]
MKFIVIFLLSTILPLLSSAQRGNYKFYSEEDSIKHRHYDLILKRGHGITVENGKAKLVIIDSSYMESTISRDSALKMIRQIPKFTLYTHEPSEGYSTLEELQSSKQKDTITHLSISGKAINKLPIWQILKCKNLKEIELTGTSIKKIPWLLNWNLFGLDSLQTLKIYNHETMKPLKFTKNTHIENLVYRDNPFSPLPENFQLLKNVKEIDFVRNDFRNTPNLEINKLKQLKKINLSHNSLKIQDLAVDTAHSVRNIILSFNGLTAVPKEIGYFKNLTDLQLAENDIVSANIDPALGHLKRLQMLSFYKNDLTELPEFLFHSSELKELDLYFNRIEKVPESIGSLIKLERLFLANNNIFSLPASIGNLVALKELYLHHNRISYLPKSICRLTNITDFHINNNYFHEFPNCILSFTKLEDLDISNNKISTIPVELKQLKSLQYLWIRGITFEANGKEQAEEIRDIIAYLQKKGVKVGIEAIDETAK